MTPNPETYLSQFADNDPVLLVGPLADPEVSIVEPVVFVDGGSQWRQSGIGISVGDGDSSSVPMDIRLDPTKDFSDLAFALSLIGNHTGVVTLHGFLGGRRDHELFNMGAVHHFLEARQVATRVTMDDAILAFSAGQWTFETRDLFSLAVFAETRVCLSGQCQYPIPAGTPVKPVSSFGLSNIGDGQIQLVCDGPVFIHLPRAES